MFLFVSHWFLGAFAKLRKPTISVVISVLPSVRPHGTTRLPLDGFPWNLILEHFSKICRENSSFIKNQQEWRALYMKTNIYVVIISLTFLLRMRNVSGKRRENQENQNTYFLFSNFFFFFENRAVYEKTWKNLVERGRPQVTIWRMLIACWIPKATDTHAQDVSYSLLLHNNNGCTNAPECYVIRTLPALLCSSC